MIKTSFCYIAHRGNTTGPNRELENDPAYVDTALSNGFEVELDLWVDNFGGLLKPKLMLGHDLGQYNIDLQYLLDRKDSLWIHCKNLQAFVYLNGFFDTFNFFFHNIDEAVLTSWQYVWKYPSVMESWQCNRVIDVMPEAHSPLDTLYDNYRPAGLCSDYVDLLRNRLNNTTRTTALKI